MADLVPVKYWFALFSPWAGPYERLLDQDTQRGSVPSGKQANRGRKVGGGEGGSVDLSPTHAG